MFYVFFILQEDSKTGLSYEVYALPVEDQSWYIGCDPKRSPPNNLNLTFIPKNGQIRSKESPLFGRVLSFNSQELFIKWIAALLVAEFDNNVHPQPTLVTVQWICLNSIKIYLCVSIFSWFSYVLYTQDFIVWLWYLYFTNHFVILYCLKFTVKSYEI